MKRTLVALLLCICQLVAVSQADTAQWKFPMEVMPEYPGGDMELIRFLNRNVHYPQYEMDNDIQGKVMTRFVVMEDGSVDSVTVVRGVSPGLDAEAVRVVRLLPKFKPGM